MSLTVSPPRSLTRERPQLNSQRRVILDHSHDMALGRAVLPRQPARPTLREPEPFLEGQDGTTSPGRAQTFPADSAFRPGVSSAWSATIRLSFWFSASSSFKRFTSSAFIPPY